jgi:hypothetical protein
VSVTPVGKLVFLEDLVLVELESAVLVELVRLVKDTQVVGVRAQDLLLTLLVVVVVVLERLVRQSAITGTLTWYAAGGTGAGYYSGGRTNGIGGGTPSDMNGTVNTGSGGGGGRYGTGGSGGAGVVILLYPSTSTITLGAGLTGTTTVLGFNNLTIITAGTGNVSWS